MPIDQVHYDASMAVGNKLQTATNVTASINASITGLQVARYIVEDRQVDNTLDVTGHSSGDQYIMENSSSIHASFGTIAGLQDDDIVKSNGSTFDIEFNASSRGEGSTAYVRDENLEYLFTGSLWENNTSVTTAETLIEVVGSPTYTTLKQFIDLNNSAGLLSGGVMSNNGDGTIDVTAGQGVIRATNSTTATLLSCDWSAASSLALTDVSFNYIYVEYNSGTPQVIATATERTDVQTNFLIGGVYRDGNENHLTSVTVEDINDATKKISKRFCMTEPFQRASGAILSETGTRNIACTAGNFWHCLNSFSTIAQDTSGASPDNNHTFEYFYYNGSAWITHEKLVATEAFTGSGLDDATSGGTFVGSHTIRIHVEIDATGTPDTFKWSYKGNDGVTVIETTGVAITAGAINLVDGVTITFAATTGHTLADAWDFDCTLSSAIDNTQYNNTASGLATLSNNQYGIHWVYLDVHGHIAVLFGQSSYTLVLAENATAPASVPTEFTSHTRLIGKIIIKKSASTFISVENNYGESFQGSVATSHADLSDLGDGSDHSFIDQDVTSGSSPTLDGANISGFVDNTFTIDDNADGTKKINFEASAITTSTTRTITMADSNIDLADLASNTTHRTSDGSGHSDVALNTTHLSSDGSDHTFIDQSVISGSNPTFATPIVSTKIDLTGGQITFPATQSASADANTLDDYEEGTFSPTIQDATLSDGEGQTYSVQNGKYQKMGDWIHFSGTLIITSLGTLTTSNNATIAGFPFTSENVANSKGSFTINYASGVSITANQTLGGVIETNSTNVSVFIWDSATGTSVSSVAKVSTSTITFDGKYKI